MKQNKTKQKTLSSDVQKERRCEDLFISSRETDFFLLLILTSPKSSLGN